MRHCEIECIYEGQNATEAIQGDLISFQYDESAEGSVCDSLDITLQNKDNKWMNTWQPKPGDKIQAKLTSYDWNSPGEVQILDCGAMMCDDPEYTGPPNTMHLKALNIPANLGFTDTPLDSAWQVITMSELGKEIASRYDLEFEYKAPIDFVIHALKRSKQSDAELLSNTCQKYNLCMKVYSNRLVIFSKHQFEQADPVTTITYGNANISRYSLSAPLVGTGYNAVTIMYKPVKSKTMIQYEYRIAPGGKAIILQQACDDIAQAEMMAKGKLREYNEKSQTGTFDLALNLNIVAGCTIMLKGWGNFDGMHFIDSATHIYGGSAGATSIGFHKCLEGDY